MTVRTRVRALTALALTAWLAVFVAVLVLSLGGAR